MKKVSKTWIGILVFSVIGGMHAAHAQGPVLVELFTSQGCNSCPPADAMLGKLAERDDIIALAYHVTYWDRLGWNDTFADPAYDARQRAYGRKLGRSLYTPQMVIAGEADVVGGHPALPRALDKLAERVTPVVIDISADGRASFPKFNPATTEIWAVAFDEHEEVTIPRGENRGKTLHYHHVVRDLQALDAANPHLPIDHWRSKGLDGVVVIAQSASSGGVIALGSLVWEQD